MELKVCFGLIASMMFACKQYVLPMPIMNVGPFSGFNVSEREHFEYNFIESTLLQELLYKWCEISIIFPFQHILFPLLFWLYLKL